MDEWDISVGETLPRSELHRRWGGAPRGGMEPAPRAASVFLFSKPEVGEAYGYTYDGLHTDGTFHYTGDGQTGDQSERVGGNKSLLDARALGRAIRLFQSVGPLTTYIGEFELADPPFYRADSLDKYKEVRSVLVFRLKPVGTAMTSQLPKAAPDTAEPAEVAIEAFNVERFATSHADEPPVGVRREAVLVQDFVRHLTGRGHTAVRHKIPVPGGGYLFTDIYDQTADELIEAKASSARVHIRTGLGQILDYSRFVHYTRRAILVPVRPSSDLVDLLRTNGISVIWREGKSFARSDM